MNLRSGFTGSAPREFVLTSSEKAMRTAGKRSFDNIYDQPDPVDYFSALKPLRYLAPHHGQSVFRAAAKALSRMRGRKPVEMLDLCTGYGVNGALINHDITMDDIYRQTTGAEVRGLSYADRRRRDAAWFAKRRLANPLARVTGVDVAGNALDYAQDVGVLDRALQINLEDTAPTADQARQLSRADMITVTGGLSYIGPRSMSRLLGLYPEIRMPWILAFPLRHTDFSGCERVFERFGMQVEMWGRWTYPHRLFADATERDQVLGAFDPDADPISATVSREYFEALLYVARPEADVTRCALSELVQARPLGIGPRGRPAPVAGEGARLTQ